jgi:predicted nucleotidyltransferase
VLAEVVGGEVERRGGRRVFGSVVEGQGRQHIAARAVTALTRARQTTRDELARTAATLTPLPISVTVFGSFARGDADADAESYLDVIMVRPGDVDALWRSAAQIWRQKAQRLTGNRVEMIEVDEHEVRRLLHSGQPLWTDGQADGIVVCGTGLAELAARRIA